MQKSERIKKQTPTSQEVSKGLSEKGFLPKKMPESLELGESAEISSDREDELEDRKSTRLNSSHSQQSRMPSSA